MENPEFSFIDRLDERQREGLIGLVKSMYEYMERHGLILSLSEDGAEKWTNSINNTLGKYGVIVIAERENKIIGFAHGALKYLPDHLGNFKIGSITHIYVEEKYRGAGIGKKLTEMLEDWFRRQQVHSIELQVISGNSESVEFWRNLGYIEELKQFRKLFHSE